MDVTLYKDEDCLAGSIHHFIDECVRISFRYEKGPFIVNPTKYFRRNSGKITPAVVNSAEYFSKKFQNSLKALGWEIDFTIEGQEIDGFITYEAENELFASIDEHHFYKQIAELDPRGKDFTKEVVLLHSMYFNRNKFIIKDIFNDSNFSIGDGSIDLRIGLEFETGNIASSFRALSKLNNLYDMNQIDFGIFVTSMNKNSSTKIWPSSNRNGSIEELENRKFEHEFRMPIMIYGFEPDGWDYTVGFLNKKGERYKIDGPTSKVAEKGKKFIYYEKHKLFKEIEYNMYQ